MSRRAIIRSTLPALAAMGFFAIASTAAAQSVGGCGYTVQTGTYGTWPGGYQGWVKVTNVSGPVATDFSLLVDVGSTTIASGSLADFSPADGGYQVDAPSWLQWQKIPSGKSYTAQFIGAGNHSGITAYVLSINGAGCDAQAPQESVRLLRHEQGHYDIACKLVGRANDMLAAGRTQTVLAQWLSTNLQPQNTAYDHDTVHGCDAGQQSTWETSIAAGLTTEVPDP